MGTALSQRCVLQAHVGGAPRAPATEMHSDRPSANVCLHACCHVATPRRPYNVPSATGFELNRSTTGHGDYREFNIQKTHVLPKTSRQNVKTRHGKNHILFEVAARHSLRVTATPVSSVATCVIPRRSSSCFFQKSSRSAATKARCRARNAVRTSHLHVRWHGRVRTGVPVQPGSIAVEFAARW